MRGSWMGMMKHGALVALWVIAGVSRAEGQSPDAAPRLSVPSSAIIRIEGRPAKPATSPAEASRIPTTVEPTEPAATERAPRQVPDPEPTRLQPAAETPLAPVNDGESKHAESKHESQDPSPAVPKAGRAERSGTGAEPLEPLPARSESELARLEAASFNGVTPGLSTRADVEKTWGQPKEIHKQDGLVTHLYSVEPFDRIEISYYDDKVTAVVIRLGQAFPVAGVEKQLELTDVRPVLVSNELGEVLGQAYPERGVLFAFEVSPDGKPLSQVTQIILEPLTAEPFVLRAETELDRNVRASLLDLEQAIELEPKNSRALWLQARGLAARGEIAKAAEQIAAAVELAPDNPHYRISHAQILGQQNKAAEAIEEAQKAIDLSQNRPHVKARALCLLGDLAASGPKPDYRRAIDLHTQAVNAADALTGEKHPAVRLAAKEVMVDAHLGAAHDIAWGDWKDKDVAMSRWLERAALAADDLIATEGGTEEQRFRVCTRALGACVGARGNVDPTVWTRAVLHIGHNLLEKCDDPVRKAQLQWDLGMALYDSLQTFQMRGDHAAATKYGEYAIKYLDPDTLDQAPATSYLLGRLYFRLGAIHSLQNADHKTAIQWFDKAIVLLEKPVPPEALADLGRHGETFVSMGVSYWNVDQHEKALKLTAKGVALMEDAVKQGVIRETSLAIPYGNLAAMHKQLDSPDEAKRYQSLAARVRAASR